MTEQRIDTVEQIALATDELALNVLNIIESTTTESYTYAQHTGMFVVHVHAVGPQVYEGFLTKGTSLALGAQHLTRVDDFALLAQNYQEYKERHTDKAQIIFTPRHSPETQEITVTRRYRQHSTYLKSNRVVNQVGGVLAFQGFAKEPFAATVVRRVKPLARTQLKSEQAEVIFGYDEFRNKAGRSATTRRRPLAKLPEVGAPRRGFSTHAPGQLVQYHFLKSRSDTLQNRTKVKIAVVDIETIVSSTGELLPYLVGFYSESHGFKSFFTSQPTDESTRKQMLHAAVEYLLTALAGYTVFGHNLFKFDFPLLAATLLQRVVRTAEGTPGKTPADLIEFTRNRLKIISVKLQLSEPPILLLDSLNFFPMSLERAGHSFCGRGKMDITVDYKQLQEKELRRVETVKTMRAYNEADCRLLYDALRALETIVSNEFNIGAFRSPTITTLSYRIFLRVTQVLQNQKIVVPDLGGDSFIRAAYRGGRTEVIKHVVIAAPDTKLFFLDFVSLYPAMALYRPMPAGYIRHTRLGQFIEGKLGIYYCSVQYSAKTGSLPHIPYLPVRYGESIIYPEGSWFSCYTSIEVVTARALGYKIKVIQGIAFSETTTTLFNQYVPKLYK